MAIQKSPAPPSRSSLLRRIRALEARLEELGDPTVARRDEPRRGASTTRTDPAAEVHELLACGRPLAAARRYREITGCDDAEARRALDTFGAGNAADC